MAGTVATGTSSSASARARRPTSRLPPDRDELIAYGPLLSDDGATWLGTAALVRAPDPDSARAVLTRDAYAEIEVHTWQFGGRPPDAMRRRQAGRQPRSAASSSVCGSGARMIDITRTTFWCTPYRFLVGSSLPPSVSAAALSAALVGSAKTNSSQRPGRSRRCSPSSR